MPHWGIAFAALALFCITMHGDRERAPCAAEWQQGIMCRAANDEARRLLAARGLSGAIVMQDVRTGAVVAASSFATAHEARPVDVVSPILPLSVAKLFLAAALWSGKPSDPALTKRINEMLIHSDDEEGRRLAAELRSSVGAKLVMIYLKAYGVPHCDTRSAGEKDMSFWRQAVDGALVPAKACTSLDEATPAEAWNDAFSLGEANFSVTLLHLSRFLQMIGMGGTLIGPNLREAPCTNNACEWGPGVGQLDTRAAVLIQAALRQTVESGTARGVKDRLGSGWHLGGKTGTTAIYGEPFDGIFAGLVFDPAGNARYTVVTYVERGGKGGGAAAEIACDLFNYVLGL